MNAKEAAQERKMTAELNALHPVQRGSPLKMRVSPKAYMQAIRTEGPEVQTADADGYWQDQRKRYPEIDLQPEKGQDRTHGGNRLGWSRRFEQAEYWARRKKVGRSERTAAPQAAALRRTA